MVEQDNKTPDPSNIKVARTSEERVANLIIGSLETFDKFLGIALGLEEEQLEQVPNNIVVSRRVIALIKSANALKQVIRHARPTIAQLVDLTNPENDAEKLGAIRLDCDEIIRKKESAEQTRTKADDLVWTKIIPEGNYSSIQDNLSPNFWRLVRELEFLYEETYSIILKNGLLTKLNKQEPRRTRLNEL